MDLRTFLALGVWMLFGISLTGVGVAEAIKGFKTSKWQLARGRILVAELEEGPRGRGFVRQWRASVKYTYFIGGKEQFGTQVFLGDQRFGAVWPARRRVAHYPPGASVDVYYDPIDPSSSVLETGVTMAAVFSMLAGAAMVVGGAILTRGGW